MHLTDIDMRVCSDKADLTQETLEKQYELVQKRTSNNFTYNMGSHVMQFGALVIDEEPVADYLGEKNTGRPSLLLSPSVHPPPVRSTTSMAFPAV